MPPGTSGKGSVDALATLMLQGIAEAVAEEEAAAAATAVLSRATRMGLRARDGVGKKGVWSVKEGQSEMEELVRKFQEQVELENRDEGGDGMGSRSGGGGRSGYDGGEKEEYGEDEMDSIREGHSEGRKDGEYLGEDSGSDSVDGGGGAAGGGRVRENLDRGEWGSGMRRCRSNGGCSQMRVYSIRHSGEVHWTSLRHWGIGDG